MPVTSFNEVKRLNQSGNIIPLYERIPADLDTPVAAYMKLASRCRESFLLESIEGGEKLARYSFIGFNPFLVVEGKAGQVTLIQGRRRQAIEAHPHEFMRELFRQYRPVRIPGLPRFTGGAVGYFGYDTIRWVERLPDNNPDDIGLPEMRFALYNHVVAFDHLKQEIVIISNILHDRGTPGLRAKFDRAKSLIETIVNKLARGRVDRKVQRPGRVRVVPHYTKAEFEKMVRRAKWHIKEGNVFQVVLSQRWHVDSDQSALSVYRRLRRINPSPYMFLLTSGKNAVVGASPEMTVRIEQNRIETRPIAGTRPRGRNEAEDIRLSNDLLSDEKEIAEHTMLLDLGRNDIGRVAEPGSVRVVDNMKIEKYSHVIHIVSSVEGRLKRRTAPIDAHFACFPAGTVSGAPKIRAMQLIDDLEKERRGIYAGSIAYLDFWGNLDSCIAIRTVVKRGRRYYVQAGAGIVADSKPAREFRETEAKAHALMEAITGDSA